MKSSTQYKRKNRAAGLCAQCSAPAAPFSRCSGCRAKAKPQQARRVRAKAACRWLEANRDNPASLAFGLTEVRRG
jgi:hypothetical protein